MAQPGTVADAGLWSAIFDSKNRYKGAHAPRSDVMVWGMSLPEGFGEFWPSGKFEVHITSNAPSWYERLREYYSVEMPESQKALFDGVGHGALNYSSYVIDKFRNGVGVMSRPDWPPFTPIEAHETPRSFVADRTVRSLASLIMLNDSILAVDEELKAIIERLDPGVHGFFPIEIITSKEKIFSKIYYIIVVGQCFDSFSPENSADWAWRVAYDWSPYFCTFEKTKKECQD